MSQIKSKNTKPEMMVRSIVHRMGYRYSLHRKDLPGKPDLVFVRHKKVIFIHGCFWHMHRCRYGQVTPATNSTFWQSKREGNVARDKRNIQELKRQGWEVLTIWECQLKKVEKVIPKIIEFLSK